MSGTRRAARAARNAGTGTGTLWTAVNASSAVLLLVVSACWAWPIYASTQYIVAAAVAIVLGVGIALIRPRVGTLSSLMLAVIVYVGAGAWVAIPRLRILGVLPSLEAFGSFLRGVVTSWHELATIATLPVGSFQALLVPAFTVFFWGAFVSVAVSVGSVRAGMLGVLAAWSTTLFPSAFGWALGTPLSVAGIGLPQGLQWMWGVASFVGAIAWLTWRSAYQRSRQLAQVSGSRRQRTRAQRTVMGAALVVVTVLAGSTIAWGVTGQSRDVLRTAIEPQVDVSSWESPLSDFRSYFTDELYQETLFTVTGADASIVGRIPLAILDAYDGVTYHVSEYADGGSADSYELLPGSRPVDDAGQQVSYQVTVNGYSGLWLPAVGAVSSVNFGSDEDLNNAIFVGSSTGNVVDLAERGGVLGISSGDTFTYTGVLAPEASKGQLADGATVTVTEEEYPELTSWRDALVAAGYDLSTLSGVTQAITLLTNSGYLSHSVDVGSGDEQPMWTQELGAEAQASRAGHSTERIEALFGQLNEVVSSIPDPAQAGSDEVSVAALGDDEQFATAAALLIQSTGKQARVVVGFELPEDGTVLGQDMRAWVQVRLDDGSWVDIAATPQGQRPPTEVETETQLQQDPTTVQPVLPEVEPPSQVNPEAADDQSDQDVVSEEGFAWLDRVVKPVLLGLLIAVVLFGPPLLILAAKSVRRRQRRQRAQPAAAVIGAWDEFVDRAVDAGTNIPASSTRRETVRALGSPEVLANIADTAAFSDAAVTGADSSRYWAAVDEELSRLWAREKWWTKLNATLRLRSFVRRISLGQAVTGQKASRGDHT